MSAPDFDKIIKDKAYDIRLAPSPMVWAGIAEALERKRRRKSAAWIFTAAALVSGLAIFTFAHFNKAASNFENNQMGIKESAVQAVSSAESEQKSKTIPKSASIGQHITLLQTTVTASTKAFLPANQKRQANPADAKSKLKASQNNLTKNTTNHFVPEVFASESSLTTRRDKLLYPSIVSRREIQKVAANIAAPTTKKGNNKLSSPLIAGKQVSSPDKWHLAVFAGAGSSTLMAGGLQQYNSFANEYNYMVNIPAGIAAIQQRPSDVKSGPSFQAGIQVSRQLSRKISVGIGLQYAYNSNRIYLGNQIDSAIAIYNDRQQMVSSNVTYNAVGNSGERFYNQYHFVAVPVELSWNFDNKQRWYLNAGFSLGYMVAVNAVHYNNTAGVYYRNNDVFRKMQTTVMSSLQYKITGGNKAPVWIGPFAQYHLTTLDKSNSNKHLFILGVGAKLQLK